MNNLGTKFLSTCYSNFCRWFLLNNYNYDDENNIDVIVVVVVVVDSLLYEWFRTKTRFDAEAKGNSEVA